MKIERSSKLGDWIGIFEVAGMTTICLLSVAKTTALNIALPLPGQECKSTR